MEEAGDMCQNQMSGRIFELSVIILLLYTYNNTANWMRGGRCEWEEAGANERSCTRIIIQRIGITEFACDELRRLGQIGIAGDEFACDELRRLGRIGIAGDEFSEMESGVMNSRVMNWGGWGELESLACDELRRLGRIGIMGDEYGELESRVMNSRVMNWGGWGELESRVMNSRVINWGAEVNWNRGWWIQRIGIGVDEFYNGRAKHGGMGWIELLRSQIKLIELLWTKRHYFIVVHI